MSLTDTLSPVRRAASKRSGGAAQVDVSQVRPLPTWFFAFEGVLAGSYDLVKMNPKALPVLVGLGLVNGLVSATVLRRRIKLVRAMLRGKRTRAIAVGLIGLRMGTHLLLGAAGAAITTATGHAIMAVVMAGLTVALLRFDQTVTFRALATDANANAAADAVAPREGA
ncbi:hypothetical protein ABIA35_006216 [Catenulispora sp. MAP12-49]|uniref:hypothetical protein n=1 Tax=Catenulispora sp. MAP12-49 TaxID=3156302 RepID=UPI003518CC0E